MFGAAETSQCCFRTSNLELGISLKQKGGYIYIRAPLMGCNQMGCNTILAVPGQNCRAWFDPHLIAPLLIAPCLETLLSRPDPSLGRSTSHQKCNFEENIEKRIRLRTPKRLTIYNFGHEWVAMAHHGLIFGQNEAYRFQEVF